MKTTINSLAQTRQASQVLETAWGSRLNKETDALWIAGYRCFVRDGSLLVRKPNGDTYLVSPYEDTCTCRAGQIGRMCKHRRFIVSLVFLSASELAYRGKVAEAEALTEYWFQYCCFLGRTQ